VKKVPNDELVIRTYGICRLIAEKKISLAIGSVFSAWNARELSWSAANG
jgi:hypothetical protein